MDPAAAEAHVLRVTTKKKRKRSSTFLRKKCTLAAVAVASPNVKSWLRAWFRWV